MNKSKQLKSLIRAVVVASIVTAMMCGLTPVLWSADTSTGAKPEVKAEKKVTKKLTGAELYAINCNRCHAERYATEFTAAQWKTIMTHMRVRANLPAAQAKLILKYLQEDAGTP
jgi:hypothetical protein